MFRTPASPQVAALLGIANAHRGVALAGDMISTGGVQLRVEAGRMAAGAAVAWSVRPERIELRSDGRYAATLLDDADLGAERELTIVLEGPDANDASERASTPSDEGVELTVRTLDSRELAIGQTLRIELPPEQVSVWQVSR